MTGILEINLQTSSCDTLDFTFGTVETGEFVVDLTNWHTVFVSVTKKDRRSLCSVARVLEADKGTDRLVRALNRAIGVKTTEGPST